MSFLPAPKDFDYNWSKWSALVEEQYLIFKRDFLSNRVEFMGKHVEIQLILEDGKEKEFWHIITRTVSREDGRQAEAQRAVRAHWVYPVITNYQDPLVTYFKHQHSNGRWRHYFWVKTEDYLVILEERAGRLFLTTAYVVDKKYMREDLEKKYLSWQKAQS